MKGYVILRVIILSFLFVLQIKAVEPLKFDPDYVPPAFLELKTQLYNPAGYLPLWYKMKQDIEAKGAGNDVDLYYLYRDRILYHYEHSELDSLKKYTSVFKDLCLKVGDEYHYYRSWDLLCDLMLFSNLDLESIAEHQKMQEDASKRKSEIGLAFSTIRIGMNYTVRREFAKAEPYFKQPLKVFEEMKCWNDYIISASNYIIVLLHIGHKEEAVSTYLHLDSIANAFIAGNDIEKNARRIIAIKEMASEVYANLDKEQKDTLFLKKKLNELEDFYRKVPHVSRIHLYTSKIHYATVTNDLPELIAYQDSAILYYMKGNNKIALSDVYYQMAENLFKLQKYKDAYLTLHKHVDLNDSIYKDDFQKQLSEMATRYNVNKLELEAQKVRMDARNTQYYYACALVVILTIALLVGIRFYLHKLKSNRLLEKQAQELIHANERVHKAQLIKSAFIQNMNHEIRTPLNAIVGFSECLAEIPMEPEEIREISGTIKKNSDHLLKIINDTISMANLDNDEFALNYQEVSLDTLCSGLIDEMQKYVQEGVKLYYTPGKVDFKLMSDKDIVSQILNNLLHNALKFTHDGEVELSYQIDAGKKELRLYVRDTGPGISSELKEKIFERFYKVDTFIQGAGLGLSLCRILAKQLGACVYLDDNYQNGCLFVFAHPLK